MSDEAKVFEGWAILELMGHRRLAGYVTEVELAGHGMLRLDIPSSADDAGDAVTQFYSPSALYALTPTTEEVVRAVRVRPTPVQPWELPRPQLEPPPHDDDDPGLRAVGDGA